MSRTRSLIMAGGLTAAVLVAVLIVGGRHGTFGFGTAPAAVAIPADAPASALDALTPVPIDVGDQPARHDDDEADDDDEHRVERRTTPARASSGRSVRRDHDDDDD
ncbi:MAG: hypothetical protein AB7U18_25655 [Dehalococcoidia bacterium]